MNTHQRIYSEIRICTWLIRPPQEKLQIIRLNGIGLNWKDLQESLDYLDAVIAHISHVKHVEKLPRYSVKATAEYLRYRDKASDGSVLFKVNNNLSSEINHLLARTFPELSEDGFLHVRSLA